MEPYIALAEKQGGHVLAEGVYVGAEILSPALDTATATGLYRAITRAVDLINTAKARYLHHLIAEVPPDLGTLIPQTFTCPDCATPPPAVPGRGVRPHRCLDGQLGPPPRGRDP